MKIFRDGKVVKGIFLLYNNSDIDTINVEELPAATQIRGHWAKLLKSANIDHLRIHDLRHIIGSDLVSNNFTLEEVAQVLGHTSTSVTKRYSKVRQEKANEALDSFFDRIEG